MVCDKALVSFEYRIFSIRCRVPKLLLLAGCSALSYAARLFDAIGQAPECGGDAFARISTRSSELRVVVARALAGHDP